jgi:ankyrin repeat protein
MVDKNLFQKWLETAFSLLWSSLSLVSWHLTSRDFFTALFKMGLRNEEKSTQSNKKGLDLILGLPEDASVHCLLGSMLSMDDVMQLDYACCNKESRPKLLQCLRKIDAEWIHNQTFRDLTTLQWSVSRDLAGVQGLSARRCKVDIEGIATPSQLWFAAAARKAKLAMEMVLRMEVGIHANHRDQTGRTVLHNAIIFNQLDMIHYLLCSLKCSVDVQDDYSDTPMHLCARFGRRKAAAALLNAGARANMCNNHGHTALHYASYEGHTCIVRLLMDRKGTDKVDVNCTNLVGDTPLHRACALGRTSVVSSLLNDYGAEANMKNHLNVSPLHVAVHGGHTAISEMLLKAGANPNSPGRRGPLNTPLQSAVSHKQNDIAWLMAVDYGADTRRITPRRRPTAPVH